MIFLLSTKIAIASTAIPKMDCRRCGEHDFFILTPTCIPNPEPTRNIIGITSETDESWLALETSPAVEMMTIETRDVAMACSIESCATAISAGINRNPPPTPNSPERMPVVPPATSSLAMHDGHSELVSPGSPHLSQVGARKLRRESSIRPAM